MGGGGHFVNHLCNLILILSVLCIKFSLNLRWIVLRMLSNKMYFVYFMQYMYRY